MSEVEADHYPEIVENNQGTRRLELLGIKEQLREPETRRALFANATPEDITSLASYVNSITRAEKMDYEYSDEGDFKIGANPPLKDKAPLMDLMAATVQDIASNPDFDDRTALRRIGLTLAGAENYVHPKKNGNGRTGRLLHYIAEFGTERGDQAFNEEAYAIIGKLRVYDTDTQVSLYDTPPDELERALGEYIKQNNPNEYAELSESEKATARTIVFLDMMRGAITVPVNEVVTQVHGSVEDGSAWVEHIEPGQIDGVGLYEKTYLALSAIPNRLPNEVPSEAQRVMATKSPKNAGVVTVYADLL